MITRSPIQIHVVYGRDGYWYVKRASASNSHSKHLTKEMAVNEATKVAKKLKAELVVHNMDGKIAYRNSYGNDPFPPRG